jgi:hypothetical protein
MDPIYNEPMPIKVAGREFTVRELPFRKARNYVQQYLRVALDSVSQGFTGEDLKRIASDPNGAANLLQSIDPGALITNYADLAVAVIADSTSTEAETIGELPASAVLELAEAVLNAHRDVVTRFFHMRDEVQGLVKRPENGRTNGPSSRLSTSPDLSGRDSITEPSGT